MLIRGMIIMSVATNNEKAAAKEEITKSLRDLLTLTITLPLGNPNLKLVHTNQFLFTELPTDVFELANMGVLAKALNSADSRYSGYQLNRWYIERTRIRKKVDGDATMELTLNPFASSLVQYRDNKHNLEKAYTDAMNKNNTTSNNNKNNSNNKNKNVKSTKKKKISLNQALKEVGKLMEGKKYSHAYQSYSAFKKYGKGDCWAASYFISCELKKRGVTSRIIQYATKLSSAHRSVQYKGNDGKWHDFPYRKYKIHSWFRNTQSSGTVIKKNCS